MGASQYTKTTSKTKTQLLTELLSHDFFFANEIFVSDDMLPHVCAGWLLAVILRFKPEAVDDLNTALAECQARHAGELEARIRRAIAPITMFRKGFRPEMRLAFMKRHLENTSAIVKQGMHSYNPVLKDIALKWVGKWCRPKYVHRYDNRVMLDTVGMLLVEFLVNKPLIENPPPGFVPQSRVRNGLPSVQWMNFQTAVLEEACAWADPCAFKALQHPSLRSAFGLSIHEAKATAANKEANLKALYYDSMNVAAWLRYAYCFMRYYLDGTSQPELLAELREHSDTAYEDARQALKPYCTNGDRYDPHKARLDAIPETIPRQLFTQSTIRNARLGESYSPDTKRNYATKERLSEWVNQFARIVFNITPTVGRRKLGIW